MEDNRTQVLALHQSRRGAERIRELVGSSPAARLLGLESDPARFEAKAMKQKPPILLVELPETVNGLGDVLERVQRSSPRSALVALAQSREPDHIIAALRLGVREYLSEPVAAGTFNDAVLRLMRRQAAGGRPAGRVLAVMGVKGGVGTSLVALNLAWCLSRDPRHRVALVDLDLQAGDLALLLDQKPERDLAELAANFQRLDASFMSGLLREVSPGLHFLPAPRDPVAAEDIRPEHLARALDHLVDSHSLVVLDLPNRLDETTLMVLDRAQVLLMVLEPSLSGLTASLRLGALLDRLEHPASKRLLVVNRYGVKGGLERGQLARVLGREPEALLPHHSKLVLEAINSGRPLCRQWPRSRWSRRLARLAGHLAQRLAGAPEEAGA